MDGPSPQSAVKTLIARARHGEGTTIYTICPVRQGRGWEIHEQMPDGSSVLWPGGPHKSFQMAECAIHQWCQGGEA